MITKIIYCKNLNQSFTEIRNYFKRYSPSGYETEAFIYTDYEGIKVKFTRLNSCD